MSESRRSYVEGVFWAATAIFVWSGSLVLLRLGVTTQLNAYDLTALRFGTAAIVLIPFLLKRGLSMAGLGPAGMLLMVCCFGAPYIVLISLALTSAPASAAGSLNPGVMAVSSVLLGALFFKSRTGPVRYAGMGIVLAGMAIPAVLSPGSAAIGHLLLVLTGVMWAVYAAAVRKSGISALSATAIVAIGSALIYGPVYLAVLPKQIQAAPMGDILLQAGFQGVLVSTLAVFAFNRSAELLGPLASAALPALIPLVTLLLGWLVLSEPTGATDLISATVIGCGVAAILASGQRASCLNPGTSRFQRHQNSADQSPQLCRERTNIN